MSKSDALVQILADLRQCALEQRLGQVECPGKHNAWSLDVGCCSWCKAAI